MKTTLKRGIDRGANGNGHAILPPGSLSPVTLYRQAPPRRPGVLKLVGIPLVGLLATRKLSGALLVALSGTGIAAARMALVMRARVAAGVE